MDTTDFSCAVSGFSQELVTLAFVSNSEASRFARQKSFGKVPRVIISKTEGKLKKGAGLGLLLWITSPWNGVVLVSLQNTDIYITLRFPKHCFQFLLGRRLYVPLLGVRSSFFCYLFKYCLQGNRAITCIWNPTRVDTQCCYWDFQLPGKYIK